MENVKSKIIPNELKGKIDEILENQLFNANRYYAESNPNISKLMNDELNYTPEEFLNRLKERWNWHNSYYEDLLEPAFLEIVRANEMELSPKEIETLIDVYCTSCLVDEATLIMSGSIKKYLDYNCKYINTIDENMNINESNHLLITPPVETYFAQYQIDHLFYIYLLKTDTNKANEFQKMLLSKYHANDIDIFNSRFNKRFSEKLNSDIDIKELLQEIKSYKISDDYKTKHFYFTLEHSNRKAIRDIIIYDNLDEKLIACNLYGISGFLLRRKILEYINNSGILNNNGYIYEFNNETVVSALDTLKKKRMIEMEKNVKPYKQRGDTCAIVCMMMALEYYGLLKKANWYDERRYYKIYGSKYMDGTPFSALAYHFSKNGLETTLYHSEDDLFTNAKGELSPEDFDSAINEYKEMLERAKRSGTNVINGIDINANLLRRKLEEGNIVILAGKVGEIYHAILLSGYENYQFIVCDPLYKEKRIMSAEDIENFMSTGIGKWFISVNDRKKEKEDLLDSLDKYNYEALDYMKIKKVKRRIKHD